MMEMRLLFKHYPQIRRVSSFTVYAFKVSTFLQSSVYCKDHSQLIQGVMRDSVISSFRSVKGFKFFCVIMLPTV